MGLLGGGGSYRDAAPLAPHSRHDVRGTTGTPTNLTPRRRCQVPLPPVVVKRILQRQKVDPGSVKEVIRARAPDVTSVLMTASCQLSD